MHQSAQLIDVLKEVLRAKGVTYRDVAEAIDLSEASVKRIFAEKSFSLKRLEEICQFLDLTIYELARLASHRDQYPVTTLTIEQETALADDPQLLAWFYLLINGWPPSRIKRQRGMDKAQSAAALARLHRLKLIECYSRNRFRLLTARAIAWRKGGPVRRLYEQQIKSEFLDTDFEVAGGLMRFETAELSDSSIKIISRKIDKLVKELDDLVELDMSLPLEQKQGVGLLLAFRPWVFSLLTDSPGKK